MSEATLQADTLTQIHHVLALPESGRLVLSTPNVDGWMYTIKYANKLRSPQIRPGGNPGVNG